MFMVARDFIAWDGEGITGENDYHPYCLFGASTGERIKYIDLSTEDCLDLIMEVGTAHKGIHVGFSFGYDVNMILKDLPIRALNMLRKHGKCYWHGYEIEHIPRKWFVVTKNKVSVKIFDVFLFFNSSFGKALRKYEIGTQEDLERIDKGKEERPNFSWANIDEIEKYWETELKYLVALMDKLRDILYGAGFRISSWHGPGALASYALRTNDVALHMDRNPKPEIIDAARYAMFGGRFNDFKAGYYEGPVHERDINSAYAYAFSRLPSLANGKWRYNSETDPRDAKNRRLGLYKIEYTGKLRDYIHPLPHREKNGQVSFPNITKGWFFAPEAAIVADNPNAKFLESWVFEDDGTYPFEWIIEAYDERAKLKAQGNPSEKALKWMLAALYGQAAQRAGWERTDGPPKWHQLEWAGTVTSECRAMIYYSARKAGSSLVSIATDGFVSLEPVNTLPNGIGDGLGQWKAEEYSGLLYLQSGIYWLRDSDGNWQEPKSRGIPRKKLDFNLVFPMMKANQNLTVSQHMFIGYGLALRGQFDKWRKWIDVPRTITFGGNGKTEHIPTLCKSCKEGKSWGDALHHVVMKPPENIESHPYDLPWLNGIEAAVLKKWVEVDI